MTLNMSRAEADAAMRVIDECRKRSVLRIRAYQRKRSWPASVIAMSCADEHKHLEALRKLHQGLGEAYNLGGY